jgi:hypothetical protein
MQNLEVRVTRISKKLPNILAKVAEQFQGMNCLAIKAEFKSSKHFHLTTFENLKVPLKL